MQNNINLAKLFKITSTFLILSTLSAYSVAADKLIGEYLFIENCTGPDGKDAHNEYPASLWIIEDTGDYLLKLNLSETEIAEYSITYLRSSDIYFGRNQKMYTFRDFSNCPGPIRAGGKIIDKKDGLWELLEKPSE
jgi:hypothetical protein